MAANDQDMEPGFHLTVRVAPNSVVIRRAIKLERLSRFGLRRPILTKETAGRFKTSTSELVLSVLDDQGKLIEAFGWPALGILYHDRVDPRTGDLSGAPVRPKEWDAQWRIPVGAAARYLFFSRTDLSADEERVSAFEERALAVYDLKPQQEGGLPPWPLPWPNPPIPIPGPDLPPLPNIEDLKHLIPDTYAEPVLHRRGPVARTIIDSGRHTNSFDIVILSEGFKQAELATFDYWANLAAYGLVMTPPYVNFLDRINVYSIRAASVDSGFTIPPPENIVKNTYFRAEGHWHGSPAPTFIGTAALDVVAAAVELALPFAEADLLLMIVNHAKAGGNADPDNRMVFLTLPPDPDKFINIAAHESCHVLTRGCEEYISCHQYDPLVIPPNQVTQDDVNAGYVWWQTLALPSELDSSGNFKVVHVHGNPVNADCQPQLSATLYAMLGLFWGCQDSNPAGGPGTGCDAYCDSRGATFYRSMAECKMRRLRYSFCRVCATGISRAIQAVAP